MTDQKYRLALPVLRPLSHLLPPPPPAQRIDVPLDFRGKSAVVDTDAAKGKVPGGQYRGKDRRGRMGVRIPPLSPGVYCAHVRLKISHTCVQATARLAFSVRIGAPGGGLGERGLTITDFERARQYQACCRSRRRHTACEGRRDLGVVAMGNSRASQGRPSASSTT